MHLSRKKDLRVGYSRDPDPLTVVIATGEDQTNEEAQVYVHNLHIFVCVQLLDDTYFPVASFAKSSHTYEWPSSREPRLTKNGKQTIFKTENFVPLVVPGLSSSSTATSSCTENLEIVESRRNFSRLRSTVFILTSDKTEIAKSASEPKSQGLLAEDAMAKLYFPQRSSVT